LPFRAEGPGVTIIDRDWGGDRQFLVISPGPTLRLRPADRSAPDAVLTFGPHPLGAWASTRIALKYAGRAAQVILEQPPVAGRFTVPLFGLDAIDVDMDQGAFAAPFRGYVFVLHAPEVTRVVEAVPGTSPGVPMCGAAGGQ
jgi:hypothetical protein